MTKVYMALVMIVSAMCLVPCMGLEQYVAFDAATASSTYSTGNLVGSPAFTAQQALSGGSGYWCFFKNKKFECGHTSFYSKCMQGVPPVATGRCRQ